MATAISTQKLNIQSSGTLDKNKAAMQTGQLVKAEHYDAAQTFLNSLDSTATVRIVNGRSKDADLTLSTQSNKGNFYSRKPVTTEFFKQACIAKFSNGGNQLAVADAFDRIYQAEAATKQINSAGHFRDVMTALESQFASLDSTVIQQAPVLQPHVHEHHNLNDEIRTLGAKLAIHQGERQDTSVRDQLIKLLKSGGAESDSSRADFLREHLDTLSSLFYFDSVSTVVTDEVIVADLDALRQERDALPEFAQIKSVLDTFDLEYTDPYQNDLPMPWYLLRGSDGSIAALTHPTYSHLMLGAPNDKIMETVQVFSLAQGQATLLTLQDMKRNASEIVALFPPLRSYLDAPRAPSASSELAKQLFNHDNDVNSWLQLAIRGVRQELSAVQKVQLGDAFIPGAKAIFQDLSQLDTPDRWPEARLKDDFVAQLRQQALTTSQVALDDDRAFAHFLFGLSATFTRLGSLASLGNDDESIPQLRFLGYVLSNAAQTLQPDLFSPESWARVNDSFLDRNACAELLSAFQLKISKALDTGEFQRFVPQVFQDAAV